LARHGAPEEMLATVQAVGPVVRDMVAVVEACKVPLPKDTKDGAGKVVFRPLPDRTFGAARPSAPEQPLEYQVGRCICFVDHS